MPLLKSLKPHLLPLLLLCGVAFGSYWSILGHDFLVNWDDPVYVTGNEAVRGLTIPHIRTAFTTFIQGNYAPLQIISYMIDYEIRGMKAGGFLLTNLLLHTCSGIIFYSLVMLIHKRKSWAFIAAILFLCHPVQVESVAWVSQRKNVLALFFFLLALLCYLLFRNRPRSEGKLFYAASLMTFVLALLAKSAAIVLPVMLILYDVLFLKQQDWRRFLMDKIPYCAAAIGVALLTFLSQSSDLGGGRDTYWGGSPLATFYTMLPVFARYLEMLFWPLHLSPGYAQPFKTGVDKEVVLAGLLLAGIALAGFQLFRRNRPLCYWLIFFFVALLPVAQIIPLVTLMNDRYLYFPMLGFAAFSGGVITTPIPRFRAVTKQIPAVTIAFLLLVLPWLTYHKAAVWENALTLWKDAVKNEPECSLAWLGLGHAFLINGDTNEALEATLRSYNLFPDDRDTLFNLGLLYMLKKDNLKARPFLVRLVTANPGHARGQALLGENFLLTGDLARAAEHYQRALALQPGSLDPLTRLGEIALETGHYSEADDYLRQALAAGGDQAMLGYKLAWTACRAGDANKALAYLETAFKQGFRGFTSLERNRDFDGVRQLPEFQQLLHTYGGYTR